MILAARPFEHRPVAAFRGARDYVHSTDLYEEILRGAASRGLTVEGPIDLRIRARITRTPLYTFSSGTESPDKHAPATCTFRCQDMLWVVSVTETSAPVAPCKPYDESPASRCSRIDGMAIRLTSPTGLTPIECLTALGVALHRSAFPQPSGKRWLLGQLTLSRPLVDRDSARMEIAIVKTAGGGITRSTVTAEDGEIGAMVFLLA